MALTCPCMLMCTTVSLHAWMSTLWRLNARHPIVTRIYYWLYIIMSTTVKYFVYMFVQYTLQWPVNIYWLKVLKAHIKLMWHSFSVVCQGSNKWILIDFSFFFQGQCGVENEAFTNYIPISSFSSTFMAELMMHSSVIVLTGIRWRDSSEWYFIYNIIVVKDSMVQWLRCRSACLSYVLHDMKAWVRIPPGADWLARKPLKYVVWKKCVMMKQK